MMQLDAVTQDLSAARSREAHPHPLTANSASVWQICCNIQAQCRQYTQSLALRLLSQRPQGVEDHRSAAVSRLAEREKALAAERAQLDVSASDQVRHVFSHLHFTFFCVASCNPLHVVDCSRLSFLHDMRNIGENKSKEFKNENT